MDDHLIAFLKNISTEAKDAQNIDSEVLRHVMNNAQIMNAEEIEDLWIGGKLQQGEELIWYEKQATQFFIFKHLL